jgi:methionyl-tRNA formyltransferase
VDRVFFIGAYAYAAQVLSAMPTVTDVYTVETPTEPRWQDLDDLVDAVYWSGDLETALIAAQPQLVVVAGWRKLVPIVAPTVGFHSAKLPEYPGRAPVANAILRGDHELTNTMLWLTDSGEPDDGDIIDTRTFPIGVDPDAIYRDVGYTSGEMLRQHWHGLLDGSAPRTPQDMSKRGPLTPKDAWRRLAAKQPDWIEAFG